VVFLTFIYFVMSAMPARKFRTSAPEGRQSSPEIDRVDRAILRQLQRDASISNVALAAKVNLSAPACLRRVERLKEMGLIRGVVALLNAKALEAGMLVMIGVVLDRSTPDSFADFEKAAQKVSGCMECHVVTALTACMPSSCFICRGCGRSAALWCSRRFFRPRAFLFSTGRFGYESPRIHCQSVATSSGSTSVSPDAGSGSAVL
jgi:DNA-binding Lrp family transcriptional regulator